jgi:hypothetical protein
MIPFDFRCVFLLENKRFSKNFFVPEIGELFYGNCLCAIKISYDMTVSIFHMDDCF